MAWGDIFEVLGVVKRTVISSDDFGELLKIDCTISENYDYNSEVTAFPVEDGSNLNDHIIKKPISITLSGIISDDPIELFSVVGRISRQIQDSGRPSKTAHEVLKRIEREGFVLTITTSLDEYENMVMTRYTPNKNSRNTNALEFTAAFQQIEFASTKIIEVPKDEVSNKVTKKVERGTKTSTQANDAVSEKAQQKKSFLASGVDLASGGN